MSAETLAERARSRFRRVYGRDPELVAVAPGRVNLIGEHTDYNDGFVLPMAIERFVAVAAGPREDRRLRAHALAFGETREAALDGQPESGPDDRPRGRARGAGFMGYVRGVAWSLAQEGHELLGCDLLAAGDVPRGSGLASSAALGMAVARALTGVAGIPWEAGAMARVGQRAENDWVGVRCGIMDPFAAAACREGCALLLDCRSLETDMVPIPEKAAVVVMDTGVHRVLAASAYNERRAACEAAVRALQGLVPEIVALRDVDNALLERGRDRLDPDTLRRARHVVSENLRPVAMAEALRREDLASAGALMNESHASLRELYEVSSPELDAISALARSHSACHGARMTGAGFGGCAVALVASDGAAAFVAEVQAAYRKASSQRGRLFATRPQPGARLLA
jgi:galactokinase